MSVFKINFSVLIIHIEDLSTETCLASKLKKHILTKNFLIGDSTEDRFKSIR